jgi:8-amino-7-oxononanoate synthase
VSKLPDVTGLTPSQKRAVVKELLHQRAAQVSKAVRSAPLKLRHGLEPGSRRATAESFFKFEDNSDYRAAKTMMELAKAVGVANPYYRDHDGNARAVTSIGGKSSITFANYNYLGLSGHPVVSQAAKDAIDRYGTSVSASRIVSGQRPVHRQLEAEIAACLGVDASIVFIAGFTTNVTTLGHLFGPKDLILHDALAHNSLIQGAILSGARRVPFPHSDWAALDKMLGEMRDDFTNVLIVVEGMYSMDGDFPDVRPLIEIKKRRQALLMIDEAHSIGVLGKRGFGIGEHFGIARSDVDIWMGTLSKSFASCGGYIAGRNELVDYLRYTAPGAVYSVGLSPPDTAAALAAFGILKSEPERLQRLRANGRLFLDLAREQGLDTGHSMGINIVPVIIGSSALAVVLSNALLERGINVQPIVHPAVPEKSARLRFFLSSEHTEEQIRFGVEATAEELRRLRR